MSLACCRLLLGWEMRQNFANASARAPLSWAAVQRHLRAHSGGRKKTLRIIRLFRTIAVWIDARETYLKIA